MSTEEQEALIGRLVIERTKAQQQSALLWSEMRSTCGLLGNIWGNFGVQNPDMDFALSKIDEITKRGGLEKLRTQIIERKSVGCESRRNYRNAEGRRSGVRRLSERIRPVAAVVFPPVKAFLKRKGVVQVPGVMLTQELNHVRRDTELT